MYLRTLTIDSRMNTRQFMTTNPVIYGYIQREPITYSTIIISLPFIITSTFFITILSILLSLFLLWPHITVSNRHLELWLHRRMRSWSIGRRRVVWRRMLWYRMPIRRWGRKHSLSRIITWSGLIYCGIDLRPEIADCTGCNSWPTTPSLVTSVLHIITENINMCLLYIVWVWIYC